MRRIAVIAAAAVLALALAGCGSQAASSSSAASSAASSEASASASDSAASSSSVAAQSAATVKWTEVKTADEAAKGAGFDKFGVMNFISIDGAEYKDPKFAYADGVAQATYEQGAIALIVRKADGKHTATLSDRDKTDFAQTWQKNYEGLDVTCYGAAKGAATVVTWTDGTKEYGVTFQGLGGEEVTLDSDEVDAVVKAIKEADGAEKKAEETSSGDGKVVVPDVVGMDAEDAGAAIEKAGLSPDGDTQGTITSQSPAAGTSLDPGDTVSITAKEDTSNPDGVYVPDVIGMDAEDAGAAIEGAGLSPDGDTQGTVTSQSPAAGTLLDPGDTVSIETGSDSDVGEDNSEGNVVPDVIGMDAEDAGAAIEGAGLSPDGDSEGTVVDQSPAAGTRLDPGDTVSIRTE